MYPFVVTSLLCLVLLCWREAAFLTYQIVHRFPPPPFHCTWRTSCVVAKRKDKTKIVTLTVLSVCIKGVRRGIAGRSSESVAEDATCIGLA